MTRDYLSLRFAPAVGGSATAFPWREAMQFGLGVLRLSPRDFWAMTPRELASAMEAVAGGPARPLRRDTLTALMRAYPDTEATHGR